MTCLVIGANRGIGLEVTRQLVSRGESVTATCRNDPGALAKMAGIKVVSGVDIGTAPGLVPLTESLEDASLDAMWVVAGIMRPVSLDNFDEDAVVEQFRVNAGGPLRAVVSLQAKLRDGAKVVLVTSRMGSIEDNTSGGSYGYRMSKAALNMAGRSLAHDLAGRQIAVQLMHPGFVQTDMTGHRGNTTPDASAGMLLARFDALSPATSGTFVHANGERLPW